MRLKTVLLTMLALSLMASNAFAKPEHLPIKRSDARAKQNIAKAQIKQIDLRNIEDPEARKAIREILNYLNLQSQK